MSVRFFGLTVRLHATWVLVLVLIVLSLSALGGNPSAPVPEALRWLIGIGVAGLFFVSVLLHELVHAAVARRLGVSTAHIVLLVFGGTPHLARETDEPRSEALIALAGPLFSLLLAGALLLVWALTYQLAGLPWLFISSLAWWAGVTNLLLGGLNLVPAFPLDGLRLLRALLWRVSGNFLRATRLATWVGRGLGYGVIGVGLALALGGELIIGIWLALIGWLLNQAAESAYRRVEFGLLVADMLVRDVMEHDIAVVGPNLTLDTLVEQHRLGGQAALYPVTTDGQLVGTVEMAQVKGVPRSDWSTTRVTDVMRRTESMPALTEVLSLLDAVRRLDETGASALPVVAEDDRRRLLGLVTREGLARAIRQRAALRRGAASGSAAT